MKFYRTSMLKLLLLLFLVLSALYWLGPRPPRPRINTRLPEVPTDLSALEQSIRAAEAAIPNIKPDNTSRIVWADSTRKRTPYSIVYLPGFAATYVEAEPVHRELARKFGCNLYLPRLHQHGLDDVDAMEVFRGDSLLRSACHALAVGKQLGEKVILMGTSSGCTLALVLAAAYPEVACLILYSPNIRIRNSFAWILDTPWGLHLARQVHRSWYREFEQNAEYKKYWYTKYRLEGLVQLQGLVEETMHYRTFQQIQQPLFLGYYYKNEREQDEVVSVPAMLRMFEQVATDPAQKHAVAFPASGHHVIGSYITSADVDGVLGETEAFLREVLGREVDKLMD